VAFSVVVSDVPEREQGPGEEVAVQNAVAKAQAVAADYPEALVLGADTIVELDGRIYGKAADPAQARDTLRALSGRRHSVVGGICLTHAGRARTASARTAVSFRELSAELIEWYLDSGEWRERAGCYAIQGRGAALVGGIEGDYLNVVGLPVPTLLSLEPELVG
jgi:septum formation protein